MNEKILTLLEKQKYQELKKELINYNEVDIADIMQELKHKDIVKIFLLLPKDLAANTFSYLNKTYQHIIINSLSDDDIVNIIEKMAADDVADVFSELPANVVAKILRKTNVEKRDLINQLLHYEQYSAGSIMTSEYVIIKGNITIKESIDILKKCAKDKETIEQCFIVDDQRKLLGTLSLTQILLSNYEDKVFDIMSKNIKYVSTNIDQELVAQKMKKYDLNIIPVVDSEKRMVGIITIDDIVDIIESENTEDIEKMAAIRPTDKPYMEMSVFEIWKKRIPWLLLLMISATFTSKIIQGYENALTKVAILTSFIPMFMDTAGNAGGQTSVTIIRGLSLKQIKYKDIFKIIFKEFKVAILVGIALAIANFGKLLLIDHVEINIAIVVCITLITTIIFAKLIGCCLPIFAKKLGFDPAVMASPFITTIVDAVSLIIYFQVATCILGL